MLTKLPVPYDNCVAVKAVVVAFNQEKALVGAFSVITNLFQALLHTLPSTRDQGANTRTKENCFTTPALIKQHRDV